ncbi:10195_t:CDS:1, partial [Cetraspora pellucida]
MTLALCIMNLVRVLLSTISSTYFWCFYEISSVLYSTIIWTSLLITGRRFYDDSSCNILSKLTILSIVILNIIYWSTIIFTLISTQDHPDVKAFIFQAIFWLISGLCSFFYAFTPALKTLFDRIIVTFDDIKVNIDNDTDGNVDNVDNGNSDDNKTTEITYIKNIIEDN